MALIKCSECGHDILDKAIACPKCGCPTKIEEIPPLPRVADNNTPVYNEKKNLSTKQLYTIASVVVAFLICFWALGSGFWGNRELFEKTDSFVESLNTTIQSYGLLGGNQYTEYAEDGEYRIVPMGRLINVRIEREASSSEYEELRNLLDRHYSGDSRVNKVYIYSGGTVMIDCRN